MSIPSGPIFQPYINDGKVDYDRLNNDEWLPKMVTYIQEADISDMKPTEELAFWLNAYNIITLKAVLEKLTKDVDWSGVTSFFRKFKFFYWKKHLIAGEKISLYHLENKIIRKKFSDPRIHFALNCASTSCPYLPERLFTAKTLDEYLDTLTYDFINNQQGVVVQDSELIVSEIFKMYPEDFGGEDGILDLIRSYWRGPEIPEGVSLSYQTYDWSLNQY